MDFIFINFKGEVINIVTYIVDNVVYNHGILLIIYKQLTTKFSAINSFFQQFPSLEGNFRHFCKLYQVYQVR